MVLGQRFKMFPLFLLCLSFGASIEGNQTFPTDLKFDVHEFNADRCDNDPSIVTLQSKVNLDKATSKRFNYRFRFLRGSKENTPVVIFIPGGPGTESILLSKYPPLTELIPHKYHRIFTSPRIVGCNFESGVDIPNEELTTENIAKDILQIVAWLETKNWFNSYILYGVSFGTEVASMAAHLATKYGVRPPTAVVMEGVIGKAISTKEYWENAAEIWNKSLAPFFPNLNTDSLQNYFPKVATTKQRDNSFINYGNKVLHYGTLPNIGNALRQFVYTHINHKSPEITNLLTRSLDRLVRRRNTRMVPGAKRLFTQVSCKERSPDVIRWGFMPKKYKIVPSENGFFKARHSGLRRFCKGIARKKLYDAKDWQLQMPVYYFHGSFDSYAGLRQAKKHFDSQQIKFNKYFATISRAGHWPMHRNLKDCRETLWSRIASGDPIWDALKDCEWVRECKENSQKDLAPPIGSLDYMRDKNPTFLEWLHYNDRHYQTTQ